MTNRPLPIGNALAIATLAVFGYFVFEWVFFATMPSPPSYLPLAERIGVLFISPLPFFVWAWLAVLLAGSIAWLVQRFLSKTKAVYALALIPALVIAATEFILIDNFTYTMFGVGVSSLTSIARVVHSVLLLGLIVFNVRLVVRWLRRESRIIERRVLAGASLAVLVGIAFASVYYERVQPGDVAVGLEGAAPASKKNVILFCSDGLDAKSMSAYGYHRDTTPFIKSMAKDSLVFENHFTNSAKTTGSTASMLSGKLPTTTRVIFRPDTFTGKDVHQHIPGLLRQHGYHNADFSVRNYVDPYDLNMRNGFHYANGRDLATEGVGLPVAFKQGFASTTLFVEETYQRISGRLLHAVGLRTMYNPYFAVTNPERSRARDADRKRVDALKQFIDTKRTPFFVHVHLLSTHGSRFPSEKKVFAKGKTKEKKWDRDFYDDAVLQYDGYTQELYEFLQAQGLAHDTLLVINTDHGFRWGTSEPLPLIMRFPNREHVGVVKVNSQRLDIGPTILEYLGIPAPEWLEGRSLLSGERDFMDPIYVANRMPSEKVGAWKQVIAPEAPFYTLGSISAIYCNALYKLDLRRDLLSQKVVENHTAPCSPSQQPSRHDVRTGLVDHLTRAGYDTRSLMVSRPVKLSKAARSGL